MKRQREQDQEEEEENKDERERKFNRVRGILSEINRIAHEREEERQESLSHPALTSLYQHPLSFLRSLPSEIKEEEHIPEEEEETISLGGLGARETGQRPQPYLRLFENPPRELVDRPSRFGLPEKEGKFYREALSSLPNDLLSEIYQFSSIPEEIGSPREYCYLQVKNAEEKSSSSKVSPCQENINHLVKESESDTVIERGGLIPFEDIQCSIYCLFTNLPKFYTIYPAPQGGSESDEDEEEENEDESFSFFLGIDIKQFDSFESRLSINVRYAKSLKKFTVKLYKYERVSELKIESVEISIESLIDLLLYYGPKSFMNFAFGFSEDYELREFDSDDKGTPNEYWNSLIPMISRNELFSTFGKEMVKGQ